MRTRSIALAAALSLLTAAPVLAQVQPGNPNAANESLARQGEMRSQQQSQTSQNNATRMEIQRNEMSRPPSPSPAIVVPRR